ncbi:MAG: hypothetical protein KatS3mg104_3132 [Phycisphaerae bacterium]|nr:MAG: hypothetical protein KatS3mg104_3132 [Phycisphaerae bacterium]
MTDEGTEGREQHRTPTEQRVQQGYERVHKTVGWAWWIGIVGGILVWSRGVSITDRMARFGPIGLVRHCLVHRMYFDDLYDMVFVGTVHLLSGLADGLDRYVIDPCNRRLGRPDPVDRKSVGLGRRFGGGRGLSGALVRSSGREGARCG